MNKKKLEDFKPEYSCRFHPTDCWHEVGCPHQQWSREQLQDALNMAKQNNAYLIYLLTLSIKETEKSQENVKQLLSSLVNL